MVVDARLRFETDRCRLAAADDHSISYRLKPFFGPGGAFIRRPIHAWLLTDGKAGPYARSALRSKEGYDITIRVQGIEPQLDFHRQERMERFGRLRDEWIGTSVEQREAQANAWLGTPPSQMSGICERMGIDQEDGMKATMTQYSPSAGAEHRLTYDLAFGIVRTP